MFTGFNAWLRTGDVELAALIQVFGSLKFAAGLYLLSGNDSAEVSPLFKFGYHLEKFLERDRRFSCFWLV